MHGAVLTRILIEPSAHHLLNAGDVAMLRVAADRVRELCPDAEIGVITESPDRLASECRGTIPVSAAGRRIWLEQPILGPRLHGAFPAPAAARLRLFERRLRTHHPQLARAAIRGRRKLMGLESVELDEFLNWVDQSDALIVSGAGLFTDAFAARAVSVLLLVDSAVRRGARTALMGQGVGRFSNPDLNAVAHSVLPRVDLIGLREERTGRPVLRSIGVPDVKMITTGDDAVELAFRVRPSSAKGNGLGLALRVARYSGVTLEHVERVAAVLKGVALERRTGLVPIPISDVASERDSAVLGRFVEQNQADLAAKPIELVQRCRVVVAGSYHAAVFALAQGIPAIGLAASDYYIEKFEGLADQFDGLCPLVRLDEPHFEEQLRGAVNEAWDSARRIRGDLLDAAERQVRTGRAAYRELLCVHPLRPDHHVRPLSFSSRVRRLAGMVRRRGLALLVPRRRYNCGDQDDPAWDERATAAARMLAHVLDCEVGAAHTPIEIGDFGCGNERLRPILDRELSRAFRYQGYDLRPQSSTVRYLDVRRDVSVRRFDTIFCLGLAEYIADVEALVRQLKDVCTRVIISYVIADSDARLTNSDRWARGWRHSYTQEAFEEIFRRGDFVLESSVAVEAGRTIVWSWAVPSGPR